MWEEATTGEARFFVFDYYGDLPLHAILRAWELDVSDDMCLIRRGMMGTMKHSGQMVAYLSSAPDGAQRIHVDGDCGEDLLERFLRNPRFIERLDESSVQPVASGEWTRRSGPVSRDSSRDSSMHDVYDPHGASWDEDSLPGLESPALFDVGDRDPSGEVSEDTLT